MCASVCVYIYIHTHTYVHDLGATPGRRLICGECNCIVGISCRAYHQLDMMYNFQGCLVVNQVGIYRDEHGLTIKSTGVITNSIVPSQSTI